MYDITLWKLAKCSVKDRKKIIPVIDMIAGFAEKARREGLLSLEDDIPDTGSSFMRCGLRLVVDGCDPEIVNRILQTRIYAGRFTGRRLLTCMIMTDGILSIQAGIMPGLIRKMLYAFLGEEFDTEMHINQAETKVNHGTDVINQKEIQQDDKQGTETVHPVKTSYTEEDLACRLEIMTCLTAHRRFLSDEPVSEKEIKSLINAFNSSPSGMRILIDILKTQPGMITRQILAGFEEYANEIYHEIKNKWFVFEDFTMLDGRCIQKILRELDSSLLCLALRGAGTAVKEKFFANMSSRAAALIKEDMDFMGPVRAEDAEEAQNRILNIARRLEETGEIIIAHRGEKLI